MHCPAYSELYPEYQDTMNATSDTTTTTTTSTSSSSTTITTMKSVELAIKKYQQWSSKFLPITTIRTPNDIVAEKCIQCAATSVESACNCRLNGNIATYTSPCNPVKRPKVYDCMKEFLKRKLFQQHTIEVTKLEEELEEHEDEDIKRITSSDDDVTSDYDEFDVLDTSYHADEEDATDCSCSSYDDNDDDDDDVIDNRKTQTTTTTTSKSSSPQKSALSLNCWQNFGQTDTTTEEDDDDDADDGDDGQSNWFFASKNSKESDDSDAGISDCCQLISDKSPKRKSQKPIAKKNAKISKRFRRNQRSNNNNSNRNIKRNNELAELLTTSWYQPRITTKAAFERLENSEPGSFLVRRKSRTFELCLRLEAKVKQYTVVTSSDSYQLKGAKKQFTTLKALVTHHSVMPEQLPVTLVLPREHPYVRQRYADDFDTFESLQILGILKSLQAKTGDFY